MLLRGRTRPVRSALKVHKKGRKKTFRFLGKNNACNSFVRHHEDVCTKP